MDIGGGYKFTLHRVGATLENPKGQQVFFQPGDETEAIIETVSAPEEVPDDKRDTIADMLLGDYFLS